MFARRRRRPPPSLFLLPLLLLLAGCPPEPPEPEVEVDPPPVFPDASRPDVRGVRGAVSAGHPLAAATGLEVLRTGGTAMDAAVAMSAVLAVVRPHASGLGGDAVALVYRSESHEVHALDGSGPAGSEGTRERFVERGLDAVPPGGGPSVTVPGVVDAWFAALERFGSRPAPELLEPAIRYAREGFAVSALLHEELAEVTGALDEAGRALYLRDGRPPPTGGLLQNPALASTLERIAGEGRAGFYRGEVARSLSARVRDDGGHLSEEDFDAHRSLWRSPLVLEHRGHRVHVPPPPAHGVTLLQQLVLQEGFDPEELGHNTADYLHVLAESGALAWADRDRWVADPDFVAVPVADLLDPAYLEERAGGVTMDRVEPEVAPGLRSNPRGTAALSAVDPWGDAVIWVQGLHAPFGAGLTDPETGVVLQSGAAHFSLDPDHPNLIEPGKRPSHPFTPVLATREDGLGFTLAAAGGAEETLVLVQVINNLLPFRMPPQPVVEAPRIGARAPVGLTLEDRIDPDIRRALVERGHEVEVTHAWDPALGGSHLVLLEPGTGTLAVGSDPRGESYGLAY